MHLLFLCILGLILGTGIFMYIIIMGPTPYHRDGVIGKVHKIMMAAPLSCGVFLLSAFFGCNQRRTRGACFRCTSHLTGERHWYMVAFYICLVWPVEFMYLIMTLPSLEVSLLSKAVSWGLVLISEVLYGFAVFADPGLVTPLDQLDAQRQCSAAKKWNATKRKHWSRNHRTSQVARDAAMSNGAARKGATFSFSPEEEYILNRRYVVDGMIFALAGEEEVDTHYSQAEKDYCALDTTAKVGFGSTCNTCNVRRPSRSRHCRLCGKCVRRFDHHCPWINNDVGEGTQRYFLGFLFFHAVSCTWAFWDLYRAIKQFLVVRNAWGWRIMTHRGVIPLSLGDYFVIIVNYQMMNFCLLFFAFLIALVLYGFWVYQMSYALANITMNEMVKIEEVGSFVEELPSLDLVYQEAVRIRTRLEEVAPRKPKALLKVVEPPHPRENPEFSEGTKKNKKYRKQVRKMIEKDLVVLYNRGWWANLQEVFFPYAAVTDRRVAAVSKVARKYR